MTTRVHEFHDSRFHDDDLGRIYTRIGRVFIQPDTKERISGEFMSHDATIHQHGTSHSRGSLAEASAENRTSLLWVTREYEKGGRIKSGHKQEHAVAGLCEWLSLLSLISFRDAETSSCLKKASRVHRDWSPQPI